ncbi:hypothetical protein BS78_03G237700 [Paspalum vaginatum]|nr:hypothetical protein BS78_03G237700 [Paspalum vaginatum]
MPLLPCLLLLLLGVHVPASHGSPAPLPLITYDASICWETSMCSSVNISYPFYLSNATREITYHYTSNYSCGYTDLEITCQDEGPTATPVIRLGGDDYTVLNVSYDSHTITLADSDVLGVPGCPVVRHGVNFSEVWLHTSASNANLTFVFDCDPDVPPRYTSKYLIVCDGVESPFGGAASFVFTPDDKDDERELAAPYYCKEVITVPVSSSFLRMKSNDDRAKFTSGGQPELRRHLREQGICIEFR